MRTPLVEVDPEIHEDCYGAANTHAARVVDVASKIMDADTFTLAEEAVLEARVLHQQLFDAFIAGVAHAREEWENEKVRLEDGLISGFD